MQDCMAEMPALTRVGVVPVGVHATWEENALWTCRQGWTRVLEAGPGVKRPVPRLACGPREHQARQTFAGLLAEAQLVWDEACSLRRWQSRLR